MEFEKILKKFNNESKGSIFETKIKGILIKWKFENFPEILSKPTFVSYISNCLDAKLPASIIIKIESEIDYIRMLFKMTNDASIKYLKETKIEQDVLNAYNSLILNIYSEIKDYISNQMLNWIFNDLLNENFIENNLIFENNKFHNFQQEKLKLHFQQQLRKIIKFMIKKNPEEQTFLMLNQQYEIDIKQKQLMLKEMKQNSLLK